MKNPWTRGRLAVSLVFVSLVFFGMAQRASAQQGAATEGTTALAQASEEQGASQFGGPNSVGGTLRKDEKIKETAVSFDALHRVLQPYFDFKARVQKKHGLSFGVDYNALFQAATESPGEEIAAGGVVRFFGRWSLLGRGSKNTGTFAYKVENRHRLGTDIPPQGLGSEVGYAGLTAVPFSDIGWALTNFFWEQELWNNRVAFILGVVDTTDYVDIYSLVDPWTDFSNLAFSTNPTMPAPNQGLGAALRVMVTEKVYVVGGLADANGDPTDPLEGFHTFFEEAEYFSHIEVGWVASFKQRFTDNLHLTAWYVDTRKEEQVPSGWGLAFSFNRLVGEKWEPFVRAGYADDGGALWEGSVNIGVGYHLRRKSDLIGLGLSWGRPSEESLGPGLNDQYTAEVFYRLELLKVVTLTPDVQLLVDPALNPNEDVIAIFGVRGRVSF